MTQFLFPLESACIFYRTFKKEQASQKLRALPFHSTIEVHG